jgi:hypothetical protein
VNSNLRIKLVNSAPGHPVANVSRGSPSSPHDLVFFVRLNVVAVLKGDSLLSVGSIHAFGLNLRGGGSEPYVLKNNIVWFG